MTMMTIYNDSHI